MILHFYRATNNPPLPSLLIFNFYRTVRYVYITCTLWILIDNSTVHVKLILHSFIANTTTNSLSSWSTIPLHPHNMWLTVVS